jgi:predicted amidophosphoribosyltransferase
MLLCAGCHRDLPWLDADRCPRCGDAAPPSGGRGAQACCERCRRDPPPCTVRLAALDYRFPVDAMVRRLKFEGGLWLVPVLAGLLFERCSDAQRPDCLLPVPLSDRRLAERGFNQSAEIARVLGRHTGIPLQPLLLRRARDTRPQSGLPLAERAGNLRGAFVVDRPVRGLHVAQRVANHRHAAQVDAVVGGETAEQAGLRLAAGAAILRAVRAEIQRVDAPA